MSEFGELHLAGGIGGPQQAAWCRVCDSGGLVPYRYRVGVDVMAWRVPRRGTF
jgi:hypothetical protein